MVKRNALVHDEIIKVNGTYDCISKKFFKKSKRILKTGGTSRKEDMKLELLQ